ncbi:MAG TPA: PD-(D/E)XK nuclease family protein [Thermoanaerobaculia bacterium]
MSLLRFARYREIALETAQRLAGGRDSAPDPLAPWAEGVIVPSSAMAEAIVRELLKTRSGVAAVAIDTLESLSRRILNDAGDYPHIASDGERRLAMRTAVRTIDHPMMESRGVASMLERAYRDVRDSGLTLEEFRARAQRRPLRNPGRTKLIIRAWEEYERLIARLGAIDPADLFVRAAERIRRGAAVPPQLLAGFYDMTGVQFAVVDALRETQKLAAVWMPIDHPFSRPLAERLGDDGTDRTDEVCHPERSEGTGREGHAKTPFTQPLPPRSLATLGMTRNDRPGVHLTVYPTRHDELRETCRTVSDLLAAGVDAHDIGIVARSMDAYDKQLLHRFAAEHGFRTTLAEIIPLKAHRLGRGVITLLRLRDRGYPRAEVLELVRDGLRTKTNINADKADAETRVARIAGGTSAELRTVRRKSPVIEDYVKLVAELEELTASIDVPFLGKLPGLFRIETKLDVAAAEELDAIADLFRRTQVWNRGFDLNAVVDAIENVELEERKPQPEKTPRVFAGEILRFRGRSFQHLFALRMQDDVFPQRRNEDPLVPDADRRALGVREIGDGRDEEQLLFQLLYDATDELRFSYAASDGFGKILRRSRLVRDMPAVAHDDSAASPSPIVPPGRLRALQMLTMAGTQSVFDGYLGPDLLRDRVAKTLESVTPTQLEDFGECPHKFLVKWILGVKDLDDPERELQIHHRDKGTLDHQILEQFYRRLKPNDIAEAAAALPRLPQYLVDLLEQLIDQAFDQLEADAPPFNRTVRDIERRATKRILRDFVTHDLGELADEGLLPSHFEYRFGQRHRRPEQIDHPEPFILDTRGITLRVDGTIDRIDRGPTRFRIVDYKSGKALRHKNLAKKIDRGVRLQLALYAMAVSDFFESTDVSGTIKPLVIGEQNGAFAFDLAEKREALLETLELFVTSIRNGVFPAFPNDRDEDFNSCKYCPVNHSCRTKHDLDERYAVQQKKDPRTLLAAEGATVEGATRS